MNQENDNLKVNHHIPQIQIQKLKLKTAACKRTRKRSTNSAKHNATSGRQTNASINGKRRNLNPFQNRN